MEVSRVECKLMVLETIGTLTGTMCAEGRDIV